MNVICIQKTWTQMSFPTDKLCNLKLTTYLLSAMPACL